MKTYAVVAAVVALAVSLALALQLSAKGKQSASSSATSASTSVVSARPLHNTVTQQSVRIAVPATTQQTVQIAN